MHPCDEACSCRANLDEAAATLQLSTNLLARVAFSGRQDVIEAYYAGVRAAEAKLAGAIAAYRDHLADAAPA
jgi:hypothetical protein